MRRSFHNLIYKSIPFFVSLTTVFIQLIGQVGNVPIQSPPQLTGPFAIDGFLQRQSTLRGDWLAGPGGNNNFILSDDGIPLVPVCRVTTDRYYSDFDDVFSKGKLNDDPNTMTWTLRRAMGKTDMNNILTFFALDPNTGHVWVLLAADRRIAGNNCSIDFEFLQHRVSMLGDVNTSSSGRFITAGPHGGRTVGDLIVSVEFSGGGSFSTVRFLQWQPAASAGAYGYFSIVPPPGAAFAASNPVAINVPYGAFGTDTYAPLTFVEAAVDLTGGDIESIWVKSKSNDHFDDFSLPLQLTPAGLPILVTATFYDLFHAQLNVDISPLDPNDYDFTWSPRGAYIEPGVFDPSVTGTLNDYTIQNPLFTADTNYNCISYSYTLRITRKVDGVELTQTEVIINSPCKIGKPINPDEMVQGETLIETSSIDNEFQVYPNPVKSAATIYLKTGDGIKDIQITDLHGRVVQQLSAVTTNNVELKNLPAGIYLLKVHSRSSGKTAIKKLLVTN